MAEARTRHITDRIETKQELVETMFSPGKNVSSKAALRRLGVVVQSPCLALRNLTVTWGTAKTRAQSDYIQITFRVHSELQSELIQSMQIIALGDIRTIKRERLKSSFYRASSKSTIICKL